jgi:hypothetical protein
MSEIADALAKAKERTGHPSAEFLTGGEIGARLPSVERKAALLKQARLRQRFWLVLSSVALVLTALLIGYRVVEIREELAAEEMATVAVPVVAPAAVQSGPQVWTLESPPPAVVNQVERMDHAPVAVVLPPVAENTDGVHAAHVVPPRADFQAQINGWSFAAVMPGERPRLMFQGRVVGVGQRVEGDIVFAGIQGEWLVFNDNRGAIYQRRY